MPTWEELSSTPPQGNSLDWDLLSDKPPEKSGVLNEIGRGLAHGAQVTLPKSIGQALQFAGQEGSKAQEVGKSMVENANARENAGNQESAYGQSLTSPLSVRGNVYEAADNSVLSMAPGAAGAAAGAGIGAFVGGVGALPGALIGYGIGSIAALPIFYGSQGEQSYENIKAAQLKAGATPEQAELAARKGGHLSGSIEAGGEAVADIIPFHSLFKPFAKAGAKAGGNMVKSMLTPTAGQFAKAVGITEAGEISTEMAQQAGEDAVEGYYGSGPGATMENTSRVIMPTALMSLIPGGAGAGAHHIQMNRMAAALQDPNTPEEDRSKIAASMVSAMGEESPEKARAFSLYAGTQIANGAPIEIKDDSFYEQFAHEAKGGAPVEPSAPVRQPDHEVVSNIQQSGSLDEAIQKASDSVSDPSIDADLSALLEPTPVMGQPQETRAAAPATSPAQVAPPTQPAELDQAIQQASQSIEVPVTGAVAKTDVDTGLIVTAAGVPYKTEAGAALAMRTKGPEFAAIHQVVPHPDGGFAIAKNDTQPVKPDNSSVSQPAPTELGGTAGTVAGAASIPNGSDVVAERMAASQPVGQPAPASPVSVVGTEQPASVTAEKPAVISAKPTENAQSAPVTPQSGPVFGTNSVGKITLRGVPREKIQAVRDKLKLQNVIIGQDNAVFPKGTDLKALQAEFGVVAEKQQQKAKKPRAASTDLLQRIKQLGGINSKYASDVTGEQKPKGAWKFAFGKNGLGLDDLASQLAAEGFNIDLNDQTDNGGVNQLAEMIRQHIGGERAFKATTQEAAAETAAQDREYEAMRQRAEELGIKVKGLGNHELADAIYAAEDAIKMDAIAEREALQAEAAEINALADMIENGEDIPFGDEVQTDDAALSAFLGEQHGENDKTGSRGIGEGAGEQTGQGVERGTRTGSEPQSSEGAVRKDAEAVDAAQRARAEAKMKEALADMGALLRDVAHVQRIVPEDQKRLLPVLVKMFEAAFELGYYDAKKAMQYVREQLVTLAETKSIAHLFTDAMMSKAAVEASNNVKNDFALSPQTREEITKRDAAEEIGVQVDMFAEAKPSKDDTQAKKLEVLKAQAQGKITGDQGAALKELADAGEHAAVDEVLNPEETRQDRVNRLLREAGVNPEAPADKASALRKQAERLMEESSRMLDGIQPGQPIHSTRDRNLREKSMEKARKASELFAQAELEDKKKSSESIDTSAKPVEKSSENVQVEHYTLAAHDDLQKRVREGTISAEEFKASFEALLKNKTGIIAELDKFTKPQLFEKYPGLTLRYKNERKADAVEAVYDSMLASFNISDRGISYSLTGKNSYENAMRAKVESTTDEDLAKYAENVKKNKAEREAARAEALAGMEDPKTLEDFNNLMRAKAAEMGEGATFQQVRMTLPLEQRIKFDELAAEKTRADRKDRVDQQKTDVRVAAQTTDGQVIETKHTKTGEPLFVVKAAERVERDVYNHWNTTAKRMGGWYSSYRGGGAVPGFQFKKRENADAFLSFIGGNVEQAKEAVQARRDAYADDRSQTAVERLTEMADALDEKADASLNQERKVNTARRARFAASAEASANADKALAQTMRNIAAGIENGTAKMLDRVRQKVQVEALQGFVRTAFQEQFPRYADQEKNQPSVETADYAKYPSYTAYRSDLASLGRTLLEVEGTMKLGQRLMKVADDVSDAYLKFAKDNLLKVSTFSTKDGGRAAFPNKASAEASIARSGYKGTAIVLPIKRNENLIILSPSEAIKRGIWEGDNDKRITLSPEFGEELVEKIGKAERRGSKVSVPWQLENAYTSRKRLAGMNIETPAELRAALREFIGLRETAKEPDKIKQMERAMIGRKNDGLDFFPTPSAAADDAIAAADIKEGMTVYEPQAGMGHIADRIREAGVEPDVGEISPERRELLEAKGYNLVSRDFLDMRLEDTPNGEGYDRIIMNPPFSDRRDAMHVQHAYSLLKPGGRLVSIMGEGVFFGKDKKAENFREWMDKVGGTDEKLEPGTFMDPSLPVNTGVSARMVVIDKSEKTGSDAPLASQSSKKSEGMTSERVKLATSKLRAEWKGFTRINVVQSVRDIPNELYLRALRALRPIDVTTEGLYDPETRTVYLIADNLATPQRAVWVAAHEVVGHGGIRMLGGLVVDSLNHAAKNDFVTKLAKAIAVDRGEQYNMREHTDEAVAELAAATETGRVDDIMNRYGVKVPTAMRNNLMGRIQRVIEAIRAFIAKMTGKPVAEVPDSDVYSMISKQRDVVYGRDLPAGADNYGAPSQSANGQLPSESFARLFLEEFVSENDRAFKHEKSTSRDLATVLDEVAKAEYVGDGTRIDERDESGADQRHYFETQTGHEFRVYETDGRGGKVWIDVSRLDSGSGGQAIYAAVANYAYNTGKKFIGDPDGLSNEAVIRRTSNMLSSALQFGTTQHLEPSNQQLKAVDKKGNPIPGVEPLEWSGSDIDKVESLAQTLVKTYQNLYPQIRGWHYDFDTKTFRDGDGKPISPAALSSIRQDDGRGMDVSSRLGESTARRVVLIQSLISEGSKGIGRRSQILEQLLRWGNRPSSERAGGYPDNLTLLFSRSRSAIIGNSGRTYTPAQQKAMERTGSVVTKQSLKDTISSLWQDAGKKAAQGIVDQFRPVRDIDTKAYTLLRLSKGAAGAFEAMMHYGKLKIVDGATDADQSGGVLERVFYPIGKESTDFLRWVAGNRAERLKGIGREHLFTDEDIAAFKSLADGTSDFDYTMSDGTVTRDRTKIYTDTLKKFNEFNRNVLDIAQESGLIDPESRALWEHEFYVPFYRVSEDEKDSVRSMNIKGGVVRQEAFKKLKGGKEELNDLMANTLMNWAHLIDASAKNRAAKATIEAAEKMGSASLAVEGDKHTVWYMDKGKKVEYQIDDPYLLVALNSLEYAGIRNFGMNAASTMKHWLTVGVTASPFFKVRNLVRDSVQAIATADLNYNPAGNVKEGFKLTDKKNVSQKYVSALAGGGLIRFGTMLEGNEASRVRQLIKNGATDEHILDNESKVKAMYDKYIEPAISAYNELGNRGEEVNRMALYSQLVDKGMSHADASLMARDLMDFSMQGSWNIVRFFTQIVPFMNARLQGLYKLGRAAKEDKARFAAVTGAVALASLALLAAYSDDDDWKKREDWDRDNFWWFKIGGVAFRIPKPFEIGAIATLAERSAEYMTQDEMTGKRFASTLKNNLSNQLSMNPMPQLVKPIIDVYANTDSFTGRPIETMGMEKLAPDYRYNQNTSMVARGISTAGNAATFDNFLSPVQVDHMLRGYFGWLGSFCVGGADMMVRSVMDEPTKPTVDYWKMATGGIVADLDSAQSRYVTQMYEQAKELEQAYGTYRNLLKTGKPQEAAEYRAEHAEELQKYKNVENVKKAIAKLNERIKLVERSAKDPDEKRAMINQLRGQQDKIARVLH